MHGLQYIRRMNEDAVRTHERQHELDWLIDAQSCDFVFPCPSTDAMCFSEDIDLFSELEPDTVSELNRAGFDDCTPVDTFMQANGDNIYVVEV